MKYLLILFILLMVSCGGQQDHSGHDGHDSSASIAPQSMPGDPASQLLGGYYQLKMALVEADSVAADSAARALAGLAEGVDLKSWVSDSSQASLAIALLDSVAEVLSGFTTSADLTSRRRLFSQLGVNLLALLKHIGYDATTVYVQECPMAFNDTEAASWLSDASTIVNPYLGKKHPKYNAGMLHCGELKDSILVKH